ncbi:hypothetical protein [Corallibacter sp.]|uniref:hypothetical protein n=1 Tax=Corallibacter sp. TaxID=2038084 RepID=UPI003AB6F7DE
MATDLFIISNIKVSKEDVLAEKDEYINKLKALNLDSVLPRSEHIEDWECEFPEIYDEQTNSVIPNKETKEIIHFSSPFSYSITVYPNCLEISTIYKYRFIYTLSESEFFNKFRQDIYNIISIFGGSEVIYLADNGCDILSAHLELKVWEGVSYNVVKKDIEKSGIPLTSDYDSLKLDTLSYRNITEIVYDDFADFS